MLLPIDRMVSAVDGIRSLRDARPDIRAVVEAHDRSTAITRRIGSSRTALVFFEAWNLLVIGTALVGFNYVARSRDPL